MLVYALIISSVVFVGFCYWMGLTFYMPIRIFTVGTLHKATVLSCHRKEYMTEYGKEKVLFVRVMFQGYEQPFLANWSWNCEQAEGKSVDLLYSDVLGNGVILPEGDTGLISVIRNSGGVGYGKVIGMALIFVLLIAGALFRSVKFALNINDIMRERFNTLSFKKLASLEGWIVASESISSLAFLAMSFCFIFLLFFGLIKAVFFMEGLSLGAVGAAIYLLLFAFFTPISEWIVIALLKLQDFNVWRRLITIARNISAAIAFAVVCYKMLMFMSRDLRTYKDLQELLLAFFSTLLS